MTLPAVAADRGHEPREQTYTVTVTNVNANQWFTPPVIATHGKKNVVFKTGKPASFELKEIAENGNLAPMEAALSNNRRVHDVVVAVSSPMPPLGPGSSITVDIDGSSKTKRLSIASMLICTNDGFTGFNAVKLPRRVGQTVTYYAGAYDAGTEINNQDLADIVPPCQGLNGVVDDMKAPGTGESDPALAEGGVITMHPGIVKDVGDLTPAAHGWDVDAPVMKVTITRNG